MDLCDEYITSYEDLEIHRLMLEDNPRVESYKNAILSNKEYFNNKIVLDVGCGTGILSIFCAQAGAKKVYAVEASKIAIIAKEIVKENNLEEVIQVIQSKVEDLVLEDNNAVDVIVSEWMGFYLLHEGMLDSVLLARDKFLKEDGQMFPESAAIYVAPCSVPNLYQKWNNFKGISMSSFAKFLRKGKSDKPEIMQIQPEDLLGNEVALTWINLKEDKISDLELFSIQHVEGVSKKGKYQGLCLWFDCNFPELCKVKPSVVLSTSPHSHITHWKQTVILLPEEQEVEHGEPIAFQLDMCRDKTNRRRYNLQVTLLDPNAVDHPVPCPCDMTKCILIKAVMLEHAEQTVNQIKKGDSNNILEDLDVDND